MLYPVKNYWTTCQEAGKCDSFIGEKFINMNRPRMTKINRTINSYYNYVQVFKRKHEYEKNGQCKKEQDRTSRRNSIIYHINT